MSYADFLASKQREHTPLGVPVEADAIHPLLHEWQAEITKWAVKAGRAAIFADCGLGKTFMQIEWASPIWRDIPEMATLNPGSGSENADDRHCCPLQLPLIERAVRLWSNPGETVLSPFAGIGSEGYVSVLQGRKFVGIELKPSYWQTATANLRRAEEEANKPGLFDEVEA